MPSHLANKLEFYAARTIKDLESVDEDATLNGR
jgi:hypothetical protein